MDSGTRKDLIAGATAVAKSAAGLIPGVEQAIAGWDEYQRSRHERNVATLIETLERKISDPKALFASDWLQTNDGREFCWKVVASALDSQIEEKQELFVNALIHGIEDRQLTQLEKLKFIDMLRHLSKASLVIMAEMHTMFAGQIRGPGRSVERVTELPVVDPIRIAQRLSKEHDPNLVTAAIAELQGQGLFSNIGEWHRMADGSYSPGLGVGEARMCYTDFAAKFAEFISAPGHQIARS